MTPRPKQEPAHPPAMRDLAAEFDELKSQVAELQAAKSPHEQPIRHSYPVQIDN